MTSKNPTKSVLNYLLDQNRPYSTNDIVLNLHKEFGKTAVQKALDLLVSQNKINEKINGKQKAYVINQQDLPTANEAELAELDKQLNENNENFKKISDELKIKESTLKKLESSITTKEAQERVLKLQDENKILATRLDNLKNKTVLVTKEEKDKIQKQHELTVKEWKKRKRMVTDITDAILESYPKSKKVLFEEIGIETDEEAGVKIPDMY